MNVARSVVAIPFVALLVWCGSLQYSLTNNTVIQIRAVGFDPRDLLSGHYLRFQLDLGQHGSCATQESAPRCICFSPEEGTPFHIPTWSGPCASPKENCDIFLRGTCQHGRFNWGNEQYFIPEELAPVLASVPPDASVSIAVSREGQGQVVSFLVDNAPIEQYARALISLTPQSDSK